MIARKKLILSTMVLGVLATCSITVVILRNSPINAEKIAETYDRCINADSEKHEKAVCLKKLAEQLVQHHSTSDAKKAIAEFTNEQEFRWCHEFTHYIGWELYDQSGGLTSFNDAFPSCENGVYHGIIERHLRAHGSTDLFDAKTACGEAVRGGSLEKKMRGACYHGLGHGFMIIAHNDLTHALEQCDTLQIGAANSCYSGAFMEGMWHKELDNGGSATIFSQNKENPDDICGKIDERYKEACYMTRGISFDLNERHNHKMAFIDCMSVDPAYQYWCAYGVGTNIPNDQLLPSDAVAICSDATMLLNNDEYVACIESGITSPEYGSKLATARQYCSTVIGEARIMCDEAAASLTD